jgi:O-antigen/teichoic acid export membrane protein
VHNQLKALIYRYSPSYLCAFYQRIEASPVGYRLAKGAFWSLAGTLISRGLGLVSTVVVGRMLNAHGFGELGMIQSTVGLFGTVGGLGLGMSSTKYVAEFRRTDPARAGRIIALASATAWISSGLFAGILFSAAPLVAKNALAAPHLAGLLRIGSLLLLFGGVNGAQAGSLCGFEAFKTISTVNLIAGVLTFPLMIIGAWLAGVQGAAWAIVASTGANCILNWRALRQEAKQNGINLEYIGCTREWPILVRFNLPGVLNSVMLSFSAWACGAILVNQIDGYSGMGVFNAVKRIQQLPEILLGMLMSPFLPVLSEAFGRKDMATYRKTLMTAFLVAVLFMVPFSLLLLCAPWLALLPYGKTYRGGESVVRWVMAGSVAYGLLWPLGTVIISLGRMWMAFWLIVVYTLMFLALGWVLVPRYGAAGYAGASTIAYVLSNIPCVFFLYSELGSVMTEFKWGMMVALAAVLTIACWLVGSSEIRWITLGVGMLCGLVFAAWRFVFWPYRNSFLSKPRQ